MNSFEDVLTAVSSVTIAEVARDNKEVQDAMALEGAIPPLVALFKGDKLRGTLLDTALFGALFVLSCDVIARVVILPYEIPIELIVGIAGSVIFVLMLFYKLKRGGI